MIKTSNLTEILRNIGDATPEQLASIYRILGGEGPNKEKELDLQKPALLTKGQATKILNTSRTTLWRMIKQGIINPIEVMPGFERIRLSEVESIIQGHKKGGN